MELIKQVEINIDYVLGLIEKYHEDHVKIKNFYLILIKQSIRV